MIKRPGMPLKKPRKKRPTLKRAGRADEAIYRKMSVAIIDHRIPPGTALQEDALASAFGVSRTVIRKVLHQLSHERLVDIVPNKGASVAKPSAEEARQVFDARRAVERILIERVAAAITDDETSELARLVKAEQAAFEASDKHERLRLSGDFHRYLAKLAGNEVLREFLNELISRTSLIIALYESPGAVPCSHGEHMEILSALKRRDAKKAVQYMDHHLQHIEAQIELTESHSRVNFAALFSAPS
jgi:DNA-binding GntR family transcriptional regulator